MFHEICHSLCLHGPVSSITASCYLFSVSPFTPSKCFCLPFKGPLSQYHLYYEASLDPLTSLDWDRPHSAKPGPLWFCLYWMVSHLSICLPPGIPSFSVCSVVSPGTTVDEVLKKYKTNSSMILWTICLCGFCSLSGHFVIFLCLWVFSTSLWGQMSLSFSLMLS